MTHGLPDFPPLFPALEWWRIFLSLRLQGSHPTEAVAGANAGCGLKPRDWMRVRLLPDVTLPLPIDGGASALKNRPSHTWTLAREAKRACDKYGATLATLCGRLPFFHLLAEQLTPDGSPGEKASEVCLRAFGNICSIMGLDDERLLKQLKSRLEKKDSVIEGIRLEQIERPDPSLSVTVAIAALGPDTIFTLLPSL